MWNRREVLRGSTLALGAFALAPRLAAGESAEAGAPPGVAGMTGVAGSPPAGAFVLPPLAYAYDALEPAIDAETMRLHHDKHHATYVTKLNEAVAALPGLGGKSVEELLRDLAAIPEAVRTAVRNHGGGHSNHSLLWTALRPSAAAASARSAPEGRFAAAVQAQFGSFDGLREQLTKAAGGLFGSGWVWLALDSGRKLAVTTLPNQDSPLSTAQTPLLGIDVWEHAYYLKYQNRRADYVQAFLSIVDWREVGRRFQAGVGPA